MNREFKCYSIDGKFDIISVDIGEDYFFNKDGTIKDKLDPVSKDGKILTTSGWPFYETDYGHCGICGYLKCAGTCQGGI